MLPSFLAPHVTAVAPGPGGFGTSGGGGFGTPPPGGFGPPPGPYGPQGGGYYLPPPVATRQTHAMAILSLTMGVLSWMMCPFIGGIVALIAGHRARSQIRSEPSRWEGDGLAVAGMITGGINVALYLLFGLFYLLMILGLFTIAAFGS